MRVLSVPYFVGRFMDGFDVPAPDEVLTPDLPGDAMAYDTSRATAPGGRAQQRMAVLYSHLASRVATGGPALIYSGDCLSVIGVLAGLQAGGIDPTLYWFDAHGDFHTWETTHSKFLGGMPLAMITGRGEQTIVEATGMRPLADDRVVLVDARDLDDGEDAAVASSGMTVMSVEEVTATDPRPGPIYVHVDVDVVDPQDLPAVNYPSPGGPSAESVRAAVRHLAASGRVVAASVSSWNPRLPQAERAAAVTRSVMDVFIDRES
ncbi:MAG: arginase family protein [Acidimicrobiia bacterium]